jgi:hypothetical protein
MLVESCTTTQKSGNATRRNGVEKRMGTRRI